MKFLSISFPFYFFSVVNNNVSNYLVILFTGCICEIKTKSKTDCWDFSCLLFINESEKKEVKVIELKGDKDPTNDYYVRWKVWFSVRNLEQYIQYTDQIVNEWALNAHAHAHASIHCLDLSSSFQLSTLWFDFSPFLVLCLHQFGYSFSFNFLFGVGFHCLVWWLMFQIQYFNIR